MLGPPRRRKMPAMRGEIPLPVVKAVLLCERVIEDVATGCSTIVQVFVNRSYTKFPAHSGEFTIFVHVEGGHAKHRITAELRDAGDHLLMRADETPSIDFTQFGPGIRVHWVTKMPSAMLLDAGPYDVVVFCDGRELARQRFYAIVVEDQ